MLYFSFASPTSELTTMRTWASIVAASMISSNLLAYAFNLSISFMM